MIISHKLKVIFIKSFKVSGESFEAALRSYCGKGDISAFLDEKTYKDMFTNYYKGECLNSYHMSAETLRLKLPDNIWNNYLKVSFVRDIYDTIISLYCYHHNNQAFRGLYPKNFNQYLLKQGIELVARNFSMLCIDRRCVIDFIIRYENREEDIKTLEKKIDCNGLVDAYKSTNRHTRLRPPGQDIFKVYSKYPIARSLIDMHFSQVMNDNELIQKYYPLYKERLSQEIPEPGYLSQKTARLLFALHNYWPTPKLEWMDRERKRHFRRIFYFRRIAKLV